jgi:hypothetical protein
MFVFFYRTMIIVEKSLGKKFRQKIFPKNGKRMRPVQNFRIWQYENYHYHLSYWSFVSLMPASNIFVAHPHPTIHFNLERYY